MRWVDESEVGDAKPLTEGVGAKVYYKNIPGKFIAATVYDPIEKEVIIGGTCTLTDGENTWVQETDSYGDFWFKNLKVGTYDLTIAAPGFQMLHLNGLSTEKDVNPGRHSHGQGIKRTGHREQSLCPVFCVRYCLRRDAEAPERYCQYRLNSCYVEGFDRPA